MLSKRTGVFNAMDRAGAVTMELERDLPAAEACVMDKASEFPDPLSFDSPNGE